MSVDTDRGGSAMASAVGSAVGSAVDRGTGAAEGDAGVGERDVGVMDSPAGRLQTLFEGHRVRAWAGPGRGTQLIDGAEWFPFQPPTFPTPPFPEYASGHSTFSAAGAEILRLFTGSDRFGASVTVAAGSSKVEPGLTPAAPVRLSWRTFSDAADEAGISRRYGGIHFEQGDLDARRAGRVVARRVWSRAQAYFHGAA